MDAITVGDLQSIDMRLSDPILTKKTIRDYVIEVAEFLGYGAIMIAAIVTYLAVCGMILIWTSCQVLILMVTLFPR